MARTVVVSRIEHLTFEFNCPALVGVQLVDQAPFDGLIKSIQINYPLGCNNLVLVAVLRNNYRIMPQYGFIRLNNVNATYWLNQWVKNNDNMQVIIQNTDAVNPHLITVDVHLEEVVEEVR